MTRIENDLPVRAVGLQYPTGELEWFDEVHGQIITDDGRGYIVLTIAVEEYSGARETDRSSTSG